eukprot:1158569-Pelagomonas_calceolata.AAC.6
MQVNCTPRRQMRQRIQTVGPMKHQSTFKRAQRGSYTSRASNCHKASNQSTGQSLRTPHPGYQ